MADVSTTADYSVGTGAGDISLSLTIGEGQFGTSRVKLGEKELLTASGPVKVRIGKRSELKGKSLTVRTVVNDLNSNSNRMSVTYRLSGGPTEKSTTAKATVAQEGDILVFEAVFSLV